MNYSLYTAEDFVADESFIDYHLQKNEDSIQFWENWISHHPEKLDEIYNAQRILDLLYLRLNEEELTAEFEKFESFLTPLLLAENQPLKNEFKGFLNPFLIILCGVLFVFGSWALLNYRQKNSLEIQYSVRHNPFGQRSIFQLSDGTKVTLNANSTLKFPDKFASKIRNVELIGEAFFEVTKNPKKPFTVTTENLSTTVLGTKFNVNTNNLNQSIQISLVEGKVKVTTANKMGEIILLPKQKVTYDRLSSSFIKSNFDTEVVSGWKDGVLSFKHASFEEVAQKINTLYGITLIDDDGKLNWDYTGAFENTDYVSIIKSICYAKKLRYKIVNDTIIIKRK